MGCSPSPSLPDPPVDQVGSYDTNNVGRHLEEFKGFLYPVPGYGIERTMFEETASATPPQETTARDISRSRFTASIVERPRRKP